MIKTKTKEGIISKPPSSIFKRRHKEKKLTLFYPDSGTKHSWSLLEELQSVKQGANQEVI
jgi:hypothetical protein